jgi:HD-like signal output (HDOD) protein
VTQNQRRILFVDDEPAVLEGLRNSLRKQRHVWDMTFAIGGQAAVDELARQTFDVVVSDMKMPGLDGPALLELVRDRYPATARIILTGQAERDAVLRALPVAHQFLSKPCDSRTLLDVIERACGLQSILRSEAIRAVVGSIGALPSADPSYLALAEILKAPNAGLSQVAAVVEQDPSMAAKVLQLVNSAYFGLATRVTSVMDAVRYLGVDRLTGLLLTARVFGRFGSKAAQGFSLDVLQRHSFLVANGTRALLEGSSFRDEAFTAALLHDIGQLVLAVGVPDKYATVLAVADAEDRPLHEVETEVLGVGHAEVGAYLLGVWGVPFSIVEPVAFHHRPSEVMTGTRDVLAAIHVADAVLEAGPVPADAAVPGLDTGFLESGPWAERLPAWRAKLHPAYFGGPESPRAARS